MFELLSTCFGCETDVKDGYQQSPLYYTVREGKVYSSEFLIKKGCQVNNQDFHSQSPLFYAARYITIHS